MSTGRPRDRKGPRQRSAKQTKLVDPRDFGRAPITRSWHGSGANCPDKLPGRTVAESVTTTQRDEASVQAEARPDSTGRLAGARRLHHDQAPYDPTQCLGDPLHLRELRAPAHQRSSGITSRPTRRCPPRPSHRRPHGGAGHLCAQPRRHVDYPASRRRAGYRPASRPRTWQRMLLARPHQARGKRSPPRRELACAFDTSPQVEPDSSGRIRAGPMPIDG